MDRIPGIVGEIETIRFYLNQADDSLLTSLETFQSVPAGTHLSSRKETLVMLALMAAQTTVVRITRRLSLLMDQLDGEDLRPDLRVVAESLKEESSGKD